MGVQVRPPPVMRLRALRVSNPLCEATDGYPEVRQAANTPHPHYWGWGVLATLDPNATGCDNQTGETGSDTGKLDGTWKGVFGPDP
jgi:hypothetical protein